MDVDLDLNTIHVSAATSALLAQDSVLLYKLLFLNNALEAGWNVKKRIDKYIFTKKHEGKSEVYLDTYLQNFIESNLTKCTP
jgi:hypothetical protein